MLTPDGQSVLASRCARETSNCARSTCAGAGVCPTKATTSAFALARQIRSSAITLSPQWLVTSANAVTFYVHSGRPHYQCMTVYADIDKPCAVRHFDRQSIAAGRDGGWSAILGNRLLPPTSPLFAVPNRKAQSCTASAFAFSPDSRTMARAIPTPRSCFGTRRWAMGCPVAARGGGLGRTLE